MKKQKMHHASCIMKNEKQKRKKQKMIKEKRKCKTKN